ncbi:MAG: glutaredoxin family protein [Proteobacteria bacterium]|nr:glutaredoxin family protein [Pseudomonadota bacterium]
MKTRPWLIVLAGVGIAGAAAAQYKVVGPDGRITYTDRPPVATPGQVSSLGRGGAPASAPAASAAAAGGGDASLPFALRQVAARYPVTLYAGANCVPCDNARLMLQQRGVPYSERRVTSEEDGAALERLSGGRTIPALTVGSQALRGFNAGDWASTLDAAGYPRESRLPRGWQPPPATPLVAREAVAPSPAPSPAPTPAAAPAAPPTQPANAPTAEAPASGIRF